MFSQSYISYFFLWYVPCFVVAVVVVVAFVLVFFFIPTYFLLQVIISAYLAFYVLNVSFGRISVCSPDIHAYLCELNCDIFCYYHNVSSIIKMYFQLLY